MSHVPHFTFNLYTERFRQLSPERYEDVRGHPGHPVKERQDAVTEDMLRGAADNVRQSVSHRARDARMREFVLNGRNTVKPAGFNGPASRIGTRGTSQLNTLCFSDWFESCVGLAIGGENLHGNTALPGAKARIWHLSGFETDEQKGQLRAYVQKLRDNHLTIRAGMFGGRVGQSEQMADAVKTFLKEEFDVDLEFNETCANRTGDDYTPFGIAIQEDHRLQFVSQLSALPADQVSIEFSDFGGYSDSESESDDADSESE